MEFDFLPNLPKSDLDDRTFQDLVDECLLRIPRYCPEWTNYNPSDPGITLVELFAWMTDQMFQRFNQVPRRNYVAFLELLGVRLRAPNPAKTYLSFYLSGNLPQTYTIPAGTEVATEQTDEQPAVVFTTEQPLRIGNPRIRHFLSAPTADDQPQSLRDRFLGSWTMERDGSWHGQEVAFFNDDPQPGNCFYLVFDAQAPLEGNTLAVTLKGSPATATGINPEKPPRRWEAWNGNFWEPILLQETEDQTQGFSFSELVRQGGNPLSGADVVLHLPQEWPETIFVTYQGRWIRCLFAQPLPNQAGYNSSPRIVGIHARSVGGTVLAYQSALIRNEVLGESDGTPGQSFQLQGTPVLPRKSDEYLLVTPPGGVPQIWQEVLDFADSRPQDLHYTIDSLTGRVQFGPLIRESSHLVEQIQFRRRSQQLPGDSIYLPNSENTVEVSTASGEERSYGAVPPRGSMILMVAYRVGGGDKGNVQRGTITVLKSAVPYVARVVNHQAASDGTNAESLEQAVVRAPRLLRTRNRAVTVEDFETLALEGGEGAIARALCMSAMKQEEAGQVRLLLVPQVDTTGVATNGISPEQLNLSANLEKKVLSYLDQRRLLGVQVTCGQPEYVGVSVQTEVALEPEYNNTAAQQQILLELQSALYQFLNPINGGPERRGWPFGRPVYASDIVTLLQKISGVRYLGAVQLFELRRQENIWVRFLPREPVINPGPLGLIVSWRNLQLRSGHAISLL
jgi:predicted phage baseplate assembly protein